jgi:hypothetical protein
VERPSNPLIWFLIAPEVETHLRKSETLYLGASTHWKTFSSPRPSFHIIDRTCSSCGIVFTNRNPVQSTSAVFHKAKTVCKLLVRVTFRRTRRLWSIYNASVSIEEFQDTTDTQHSDVSTIPATPSHSLPASFDATAIIRSQRPDTLRASIQWIRHHDQDVLVVRIHMIHSLLSIRVFDGLFRKLELIPPTTEPKSPILLYLVLVAVATSMPHMSSPKIYVPATLLVWYLGVTLWRSPRRLTLRSSATSDVLVYSCYYIALVALIQRPILIQSYILSQRLVLPEATAVFFSLIAILPSLYMSTSNATITCMIAKWLVTIVATIVPEVLTAVSVHYGVPVMRRNEKFFDSRQGDGYWGFHKNLLTKDPWLR